MVRKVEKDLDIAKLITFLEENMSYLNKTWNING